MSKVSDEEIQAYVDMSMAIYKPVELPKKPKPKNMHQLMGLDELPKLDDEEPFTY